MIYHIDLLLDDERRAARPVHVRMLMRLGAAGAASALLLTTILLFLAGREVRVQVQTARLRWQRIEPQQEALLRLRGALQDMHGAMRQLHACNHARLSWGKELAELQRGVPEEVQLTELRLSQFVGSPTSGVHAVRSYEMRLTGRVGGEDADAHVQRLIAYLSSSAYTGRVEGVSVPAGGFRQDPTRGAARTDRTFELVCRYRPRSFE